MEGGSCWVFRSIVAFVVQVYPNSSGIASSLCVPVIVGQTKIILVAERGWCRSLADK